MAATATPCGQSTPRVMALPACPCCSSEAHSDRMRAPDFLLGVPGEFAYVECASCATVYQQPQIVSRDLHLCYPTAYFTHSPPASSITPGAHDGIRRSIREAVLLGADGGRSEHVSPLMQPIGWLLSRLSPVRSRARFGLLDTLGLARGTRGRCLEVGPGQGRDLRSLRAIGWQAVGLESDPVAAAIAAKVSGCTVAVGTLERHPFVPGSFDLVYMNHVFEHLPDPRKALSQSRDLLAPGGRLVLVYPNPHSLSARMHGRYAWVWDPPRHLVLPPPQVTVRLLRELRLADVRVLTVARRAAFSRRMAERFRQHGPGAGLGAERLTSTDRLFGILESVLVRAGLDLGEEVVVFAQRGPEHAA
jgi:SAM-dependent methyltransferase